MLIRTKSLLPALARLSGVVTALSKYSEKGFKFPFLLEDAVAAFCVCERDGKQELSTKRAHAGSAALPTAWQGC